MVSHKNTPRSVLNAPKPSFAQEPPQGATRFERRHGILSPSALSAGSLGRYVAGLRHRNIPFVRTTPRRGRRVKRAGLV